MYIVDSISLFVNCDVDKDHNNFSIDTPYSSNKSISHCIWNTVFSCKLDIENSAEFHTHGLNQNWKSVEIWSTSTVIKVMNLKSIYDFLYYRPAVRKKLSYLETNLDLLLIFGLFSFLGNCPIVTEKGYLDWKPCNVSINGCPDTHFVSNEVYQCKNERSHIK